MSYINDNLTQDETVVTVGELHWIIYLPSIITLLLTLVILTQGFNVATLLFGIFVAGILAVRPFILAWSTESATTSKRCILKTGLIRRDTLELKHDKIESISIKQTIMGRILNYGNITISGTGGIVLRITTIRRPNSFKKKTVDTVGI